MKISKSTKSTTRPKKRRVKVGSNGRKEHNGKIELNSKNKVCDNKVDGTKIEDNEIVKEKNYQKTSKCKKMIEFSDFFTFRIFTKLKQILVKALIFYYLDSKYYIRIEKDVLSYAIGEIFSQLILDNLGQ